MDEMTKEKIKEWKEKQLKNYNTIIVISIVIGVLGFFAMLGSYLDKIEEENGIQYLLGAVLLVIVGIVAVLIILKVKKDLQSSSDNEIYETYKENIDILIKKEREAKRKIESVKLMGITNQIVDTKLHAVLNYQEKIQANVYCFYVQYDDGSHEVIETYDEETVATLMRYVK